MFWNYILHPGFLYSGLFQMVPAAIPTMPDLPQEAQRQNQKVEKPKTQEQTVLELTKEDLLEGGYIITKKPWTEEEDLLLQNLRDKKGLDWNQIAELIPQRNSKMCYSRYRRLQNHCKEIWRKVDNENLIKLVCQHGENWKIISQHFKRRTQKQIKEHYMNFLRPNIKKDEWSIEEDLKLITLLKQFGTNWKIIQESLGGRTQNQIKNRYFGRLKRLAEKKMSSKAQQKKPISVE